MVYLRQDVHRHEIEIPAGEELEYATCWASIGYWNGKNFGTGLYQSNEDEAVEITVDEAEYLICLFDNEEQSGFIEYSIVEEATKPSQDEWERLY